MFKKNDTVNFKRNAIKGSPVVCIVRHVSADGKTIRLRPYIGSESDAFVVKLTRKGWAIGSTGSRCFITPTDSSPKDKCENCGGTGCITARVRRVETGKFSRAFEAVCPVCCGTGFAPEEPEEEPEVEGMGPLDQMVRAAAKYRHGHDYMESVVEPALEYIASQTPTHDRWRHYYAEVTDVLDRNVNCHGKGAAISELTEWIEGECRKRRAAYKAGLSIKWDTLRKRVQTVVENTGRKPYKRSRRSLAAFYASNLPLTQ